MQVAPRLILASASPRRAKLLGEAGIAFETKASDVDERAPRKSKPQDAAVEIATRKARAVAQPGAWVLAADTLVVYGGRLLGKPADETEAHAILRMLSGETHEVVTGVVVLAPDGKLRADTSATKVSFRVLTDEEIDAYVRTGDPMDKAGGYGIQGKASKFVERVEGPLDTVVGLPVELTRRLLREAGFPGA